MAALFRTSELADVADGKAELSPLPALILARVATERGATRAEVLRDIGRIVSNKYSPGEWRALAEDELLKLVDAGFIDKKRTRYVATIDGEIAINRFLDRDADGKTLTWSEQRDTYLVAKALGLEKLSSANLKTLKRPEGLRSLILQHAFQLPLNGNQPAQSLRTSLAVIALERAFGNKIKTGLGANENFSAKAGRALAGQLSRHPREFGSDGKLIASLAAEIVDARQTDFDSLQLEILRRLTSPRTSLIETAKANVEKIELSSVAEAHSETKTEKKSNGSARKTSKTELPDLTRFADCVHEAARQHAEGWPGNQKAFISHVWQVIRTKYATWGISEIEFKYMLAEAHRAGHIVLANADLKNKRNIAEIEASAITYKNTVWHLVRVLEEA